MAATNNAEQITTGDMSVSSSTIVSPISSSKTHVLDFGSSKSRLLKEAYEKGTSDGYSIGRLEGYNSGFAIGQLVGGISSDSGFANFIRLIGNESTTENLLKVLLEMSNADIKAIQTDISWIKDKLSENQTYIKSIQKSNSDLESKLAKLDGSVGEIKWGLRIIIGAGIAKIASEYIFK